LNPFLFRHIERIGRRIFGIKFSGDSEFLAETLSEDVASKLASAFAGYYKIPLREYDDNTGSKRNLRTNFPGGR
jgi:hypothetical protein